MVTQFFFGIDFKHSMIAQSELIDFLSDFSRRTKVTTITIFAAMLFSPVVAAGSSIQEEFRSVLAQVGALDLSIRDKLSELEQERGTSAYACQGRLSLVSNTPVATSDVSDSGNLYFVPYRGNQIAIYNGTNWIFHTMSAQISEALSLSANTTYDVFVYDNSGTLDFYFEAWASATARNVALATQDSVYVHGTVNTRRYVGTIRTSNANQTTDSSARRLVWNYCQRLTRFGVVNDTTDSWATVNTRRVVRAATTTNIIDIVIGLNEEFLSSQGMLVVTGDATLRIIAATGAGVDATTFITETLRGVANRNSVRHQTWSFSQTYPGIGFHTINWLEQYNSNTGTVYGDGGDARVQSGLYLWYRG